jgi:hypothetical protein
MSLRENPPWFYATISSSYLPIERSSKKRFNISCRAHVLEFRAKTVKSEEAYRDKPTSSERFAAEILEREPTSEGISFIQGVEMLNSFLQRMKRL